MQKNSKSLAHFDSIVNFYKSYAATPVPPGASTDAPGSPGDS